MLVTCLNVPLEGTHRKHRIYRTWKEKKKSVIIALITFVKMRKDPILPPSKTGDWIHPIYQSHATYVDNV